MCKDAREIFVRGYIVPHDDVRDVGVILNRASESAAKELTARGICEV
jgi:hypothetical protein